MALNAHRVFSNSTENNFLAALTVDAKKQDQLRNARDEIRGTLRTAFQDWSVLVESRELFETAAAQRDRLTPKFRMQGSFAYRTLNEPSQVPQEIDLDDGMFMPVTYLAENGSSHPGLISDGYFSAVEGALAPLCNSRGWTLQTDLPSCVRVRLDDGAHVDVALYAIPDDEFEVLLEKAAVDAFDQNDRVEIYEGIEFSDQVYRQLAANQIMLAHRDEGWKPSDPRKLDEWFHEGLNVHGEQFRRVCRYLKGWRDHSWPTSRLASIALMACARDAFDADRSIPQDRDDLRILDVAKRLPAMLNGRIPNPVVDGQRLDEKWESEARQDYVDQAEALAHRIEDALFGTDEKQVSVSLLIAAFGTRIPNDVSLIVSDEPPPEAVAAPAILSTGMLGEMGERAAKRDVVRKDGDGRYG